MNHCFFSTIDSIIAFIGWLGCIWLHVILKAREECVDLDLI